MVPDIWSEFVNCDFLSELTEFVILDNFLTFYLPNTHFSIQTFWKFDRLKQP